MFCSNCGKELEAGDVFCGYCGARLEQVQVAQESPAVEEPAARNEGPAVEGAAQGTQEGPAAPGTSTSGAGVGTSGAGVGTSGAGKGPVGQGATMNTTAPSLLDRWKYNSGIRHLIAAAISILLVFDVFGFIRSLWPEYNPLLFLRMLCIELGERGFPWFFYDYCPIAFIIFPLVILLLLPLLPPHGYVVAIRIWGIAAIGILSLFWMPFYQPFVENDVMDVMDTGFVLHIWPLGAFCLVLKSD